ncbi:hypothetical protein BKA82DRAFT_874171 [Pisolithus tinctorius]|uniref:Uncharacterized protein n=1 Tax=Pisolithus tinctorius Marx 270 TaxID=870435 RepID=A0A0C3PQE7_PISTI|nr:hypothetical protein BKA82DRAFT_874171 [Pisolithus tinctorius]KIO10754.1 hypothetical protein M404DRAFT_874171 [Pisolithus tinctorius Marx 270]
MYRKSTDMIYCAAQRILCIGYGVTANIAASHIWSKRGSSGFDSPYPSSAFFCS